MLPQMGRNNQLSTVYMKYIDKIQEDILCFVLGIIAAAWFLAMVMGDGSIGFLELFR